MKTMIKPYSINLELYAADIKNTENYYVQGDSEVYPLHITLLSNGNPFELPANAVISINFENSNTGNVYKGIAEITDATKGEIYYSIIGEEIYLDGEVLASVEVQCDEKRLTWQQFKFIVERSLGLEDAQPPEQFKPWTAQISSEISGLKSMVDEIEISNGVSVSIGDIITETVDESNNAEVDIEKDFGRLNFKFKIPKGKDGNAPRFKAGQTHIQASYDGQEWENVIALSEIKGEAGAAGKSGEKGKDAYQLAVENGFVGSEQAWVNSLKGSRGEKGLDASVTNADFIVSAIEPSSPKENDIWIRTGGVTVETQPLSQLPVGAVLVDKSWNYFGEPVHWVVVSQNHNSLDSGYPANASTLMARNVICFKGFDGRESENPNEQRATAGNQRYGVSNIRQWLNSNEKAWYNPAHTYDKPPDSGNLNYNFYKDEAGFMNGMSAKFKEALLTTSIESVIPDTDGGGIERLGDKVFLASALELEGAASTNEGKQFKYFTDGASRKIMPSDSAVSRNNFPQSTAVPGEACQWWTRTRVASAASLLGVVKQHGYVEPVHAHSSGEIGVVPFVNIKNDTKVSAYPIGGGIYELLHDEEISSYGHWTQAIYFNGEWNTQEVTSNSVSISGYLGKEQEPVFLKTFDGSNQPYHPDILYFDDKDKFGWKYIMAYTPYPIGAKPYRDRWECPCLAVSDNLVDWTVPSGFDNPLDDLTQNEIDVGAYFSDPYLVYNPSLDRIELYYRLTLNSATLETHVFRKYTTSKNLSGWSEREFLFNCSVGFNNGLGGMTRSSTMIFKDGIYRMWYGQGGINQMGDIYCAESPNGKDNWVNVRKCVLSDGKQSWHPSVKYYGGKYHLINYRTNSPALDYYVSDDGIYFTFQKELITLTEGTFYSSKFYRSDIVYNGHTYSVIFTAEDSKKARFGLLQGTDMLGLHLVDGDYYGREARSLLNI